MDVESLINNTLKLSSIKNGSFDYSICIESDILKFYEENYECSPLLFEYILYKMIQEKLKNRRMFNSDIIIISEEYININENIKEYANTSTNKLLVIPFINNSSNKWGLILLSILENNNFIIKMFVCDKINKQEIIFNNIATKINSNFIIEDKNKINVFDISSVSNTSKFLINFLNELLEIKVEKMDDFLMKIANHIEKKEVSKSDENTKINYKDEITIKLSDDNELFKNLISNYNKEYNDYIKNQKNKIEKNEIEKKIGDSSPTFEDVHNHYEKNLNIEKEVKEREKNLLLNDEQKNCTDLENKNKEEIDNENEINLKNKKLKDIDKDSEKDSEEDLEELAQKIVKNIMNLDVDKQKRKPNLKKNFLINNNKGKKLDTTTKNIIEDNSNNLTLENTNKKIKTEALDKLEINDDDDIFDIDNYDDDCNMDNNSTDDIFDLNFKQSNCDNNCRHKKIDDVTKNTINDILDSVLNDMKSSKNKYNKRYMKKNNKITSKYRLRTINIDQRIETIEEEDKESSTSEVNKNEKNNLNNEEDKKINNKDKDELKETIKINNSFEIERRPSMYSFNEENNDENNKIKKGEIEFEEKEIQIGQKIDENKTEKIILDNLNIDNIKENNNKDNIENKNDKTINNINNYNEQKKENENMRKDFKINSNEINNNNNNINDKITHNNQIIDNNNNNNNNISNIKNNNNKNNNYNNNNIINNNINKNNNDNENNNNHNINKCANNNVNENINNIDNNINNGNNNTNNNDEIDSLDNFNISRSNTIKKKDKIIRNSSPKDNNRKKRNKTQKKKSNLHPTFIFKNIINNNTTNNININTINAQNVIIINNSVPNNNSNKNNNNNNKKKEEIKIKKEPEDEKVPRDNKSRRKVIKNIEITKKEPCDSDAKSHSPKNTKYYRFNQQTHIKDEVNNTISKYSSKTIQVDKYKSSENKIDSLRNNNSLENLRKNIYDTCKEKDQTNKPQSSNNINIIKNKILPLGPLQKNLDNQIIIPFKQINQNKNLGSPNIIYNHPSPNEVKPKNKIKIKKKVINNNLENKYPKNKKNNKNKNKNNTNINSGSQNLKNIELNKNVKKTNQLNPKIHITGKKYNENKDENKDKIDDSCILI